jgi:uncharacterized protein DUF3631
MNTSRLSVALWSAVTWCTESVDILPLLCLASPIMRCGKTKFLKVIRGFVRKPLSTSSIKAAGLFRKILRWCSDHKDQIRATEPAALDSLHDRANDNWFPLLAIAEVAGAELGAKARRADRGAAGPGQDRFDSVPRRSL